MSFTTWVDKRLQLAEDRLVDRLAAKIDESAAKVITELDTATKDVADRVESNGEKFLTALAALPGTIISKFQIPGLPHF